MLKGRRISAVTASYEYVILNVLISLLRENAEGFCYVNDVVLAIEELRLTYDRVLYVDLDIHHGKLIYPKFYSRYFELHFCVKFYCNRASICLGLCGCRYNS